MPKFDAVVIGAGTGWLSAALTLASNGKKILLLEQHNLPGGCSTSFIRGRFEFDASLHEYCARCRGGICGWCRSKLLSGTVFIPKETDGRRQADKVWGYIHPCASYATSDLYIEVPNNK